MRAIQDDGVARVMEGLTTLEEVQRIISFEMRGPAECPTCKRALTSEFRFCPFCGEKNLVAKKPAHTEETQSLEVATRR
jgi:rRNA maturation endonuclease Nob1